MYIAGIVFASLALAMLIGYLVNSVRSKGELDGIEPYGQLVEVEGRKMHVHTLGSGQRTIVLLPGFGVALPSADFGPLMRTLSQDHVVATVEYFGTGFSDQTELPRTNANYVRELRAALAAAGLRPPYVLMPHSASGIYCEYYASTFPEEVAALIMLDTTSTAKADMAAPPSFLFQIAKLQQAIGLIRLASRLAPETKLAENGYTTKEVADYRLFNLHVVNDTLISQASLLMENIKQVNRLTFPTQVPVLKLISTQTIAGMAKRDRDDGMGYQRAHLARLGGKYQTIDATHFMYQTKAEQIAGLTRIFLEGLNGRCFGSEQSIQSSLADV